MAVGTFSRFYLFSLFYICLFSLSFFLPLSLFSLFLSTFTVLRFNFIRLSILFFDTLFKVLYILNFSLNLSFHLLIFLSICTSMYLFLSICTQCRYFYLFICMSMHFILPLFLSIYLYIILSLFLSSPHNTAGLGTPNIFPRNLLPPLCPVTGKYLSLWNLAEKINSYFLLPCFKWN